MARDYAKIYTSIRDDEEFRLLSPGAQGLYFQLIIGDISKAGTFWWRPKVFATFFGGDTTVEDVEALMQELQDRIFVLVDRATDEGLVRSHVRYDGILKQPNMVKSMVTSWRDLGSPSLRRILENEVRREVERTPSLKTLDVLPATFKNPSVNPSEMVRREFPLPAPSDNPSRKGSGKGGRGLSHTGDGRQETGNPSFRGGSGGNVLSGSDTSRDSADAERGETSNAKAKADDLPDRFAEFWDVYGKKRDKKAAIQKYRLALRKKGITPDLLITSARAYVTYERETNQGGRFIMDASKWLLGERWTDETAALGAGLPNDRPPTAAEVADDGTLLPPVSKGVFG